jgi:hypothetical protein
VLRRDTCNTCSQTSHTTAKSSSANAVHPVKAETPILEEHGAVCSASACDSRAVYYLGGALGSGEFPLKGELRVTEAIALARGPIVPGLGLPSPTRISVLRRLSSGQQLNIRVDLDEALRDPRENIAIWPGDMIYGQETACETSSRVIGGIFRAAPRVAARVFAGPYVP